MPMWGGGFWLPRRARPRAAPRLSCDLAARPLRPGGSADGCASLVGIESGLLGAVAEILFVLALVAVVMVSRFRLWDSAAGGDSVRAGTGALA
jgi:hypothetical protein